MKASLQKLYDKNIDDFGILSDDWIMGLTIYAESRGEPREGRIAVGTVILQRVEHRDWDGKNITDVCLWPYQFSCYLPSDPKRATLLIIARDKDYHYGKNAPLRQCVDIASGLINSTITEDSDLVSFHCCQYLTTAAKEDADWWKSMKFIKKIGGHEFYA